MTMKPDMEWYGAPTKCRNNFRYVFIWMAIWFCAGYLVHSCRSQVEYEDQVGPNGPWYSEEYKQQQEYNYDSTPKK